MLVIAALADTIGLEQLVHLGWSDGGFVAGITAGVAMTIIAIITDRVTQARHRKRQEELGLSIE